MMDEYRLPSGKLFHKLWEITMLLYNMGKSTISMVIFNSYVCLPESNHDQSSEIIMFGYLPGIKRGLPENHPFFR